MRLLLRCLGFSCIRGDKRHMTISERIFEILKEKKMSQKEFSELTGIAQSSISDWKRKKTNPVSEKILIICEVLHVTPYELLGGTEEESHDDFADYYLIEKDSEHGRFFSEFLALNQGLQGRLLGYMKALQEMENEGKND